jgi:effector-binding domain-containing protein
MKGVEKVQDMVTADFEIVNTPFRLAITIKDHAKVADIPTVMVRNFRDLMGYAQRRGIEVSGPPFTYYHAWSFRGVEFESGLPVDREVEVGGRIRLFNLPATRAVTALHRGPYEGLRETYSKMEGWIKGKGLVPSRSMWEEYLNDPIAVDQNDLLTRIVWPIK